MVLAGCGEQAPKRVRATPTPTPTPTVSPVPSPLPASERAKADLQNYLDEETQDDRRYCYPDDDVPDPAIAASHCESRDGPRRDYLLFDTRDERSRYFDRVSHDSTAGRGGRCPDGF